MPGFRERFALTPSGLWLCLSEIAAAGVSDLPGEHPASRCWRSSRRDIGIAQNRTCDLAPAHVQADGQEMNGVKIHSLVAKRWRPFPERGSGRAGGFRAPARRSTTLLTAIAELLLIELPPIASARGGSSAA